MEPDELVGFDWAGFVGFVDPLVQLHECVVATCPNAALRRVSVLHDSIDGHAFSAQSEAQGGISLDASAGENDLFRYSVHSSNPHMVMVTKLFCGGGLRLVHIFRIVPPGAADACRG